MAGLLLLGGSICWLASVHDPKRNLSYQGKPLIYWFNQLPMTRTQGTRGNEIVFESVREFARDHKPDTVQEYGSWVEEPAASAKAIRAVGTNGLRLYLSKLSRQERPVRSRLQEAAFALGLRRFLFANVSAEREQAVTALILLKPLPEQAVRKVRALSNSSDAEIAGAARCVLATEPGKLLLLTRTPDEAIRSHLEDKRFWR